MTISTCMLELLRHGPPDNQLLSPFTPYLALCDQNAEAEAARVGIEHYQMLRRIRLMRYKDGKPATREQLYDAAEPSTKLLGGVTSFQQALGSALNKAADPGGIVHVHLVLSAAELELLPFELTRDQGGAFLAQRPGTPIVFTRQIRGAVAQEVKVAPPRILFLTASRPNAWIPPELVERHAAALVRALAPWLISSDPSEYDRHVSVVQQATRQSIVEVFRLAARDAMPYTHVHVLAHGVEVGDPDTEERRYTVALADEDVFGVDFAELIAGSGHPCPALVTLATCDAGAQGSVIGCGASVAHQLHKKGVPLVVASQFPLSHEGSVTLTECLYRHVLAGDDPRIALADLRKQLAPAAGYHDWASVIAYASFPANADERNRIAAQQLARSAVEAAATRMDRAEKSAADLEATTVKLREAFGRLENLVPAGAQTDARERARAVELLGVLANAKKRTAEIMWRNKEDHLPTLRQARQHYQRAYRLDMNETWAEVQRLSLLVVMGEPLPPTEWTLAYELAKQNAQIAAAQEPKRRIWALNNLIELLVLAQCLGPACPPGIDPAAQSRALVDDLLNLVVNLGPMPRDAYSLLRQLKRYVTWWWVKDDPRALLPARLVQTLVEGNVPETWGALA